MGVFGMVGMWGWKWVRENEKVRKVKYVAKNLRWVIQFTSTGCIVEAPRRQCGGRKKVSTRKSFQSNQIIPHESNFTALSQSLEKSAGCRVGVRPSGPLYYTYRLAFTSTHHRRCRRSGNAATSDRRPTAAAAVGPSREICSNYIFDLIK